MKSSKITSSLISAGAMSGLLFCVVKRKPFWVTAAVTVLFAIGGGAIGAFYESTTEA